MRPETISYIEWFGCAFCSIRVAKIVNDIYTHLEDVAANGTGGLAACGKPFILKKCNHFVRSEKKSSLEESYQTRSVEFLLARFTR